MSNGCTCNLLIFSLILRIDTFQQSHQFAVYIQQTTILQKKKESAVTKLYLIWNLTMKTRNHVTAADFFKRKFHGYENEKATIYCRANKVEPKSIAS